MVASVLQKAFVINIKKKNKNMRSNSPFQKQDKCSIAKEKLKQSYIKKGKAKEFNSEIKTMACVNGKWQSNIKEEQDPKPAPTNPETNIGNKKKSIIEN